MLAVGGIGKVVSKPRCKMVDRNRIAANLLSLRTDYHNSKWSALQRAPVNNIDIKNYILKKCSTNNKKTDYITDIV